MKCCFNMCPNDRIINVWNIITEKYIIIYTYYLTQTRSKTHAGKWTCRTCLNSWTGLPAKYPLLLFIILHCDTRILSTIQITPLWPWRSAEYYIDCLIDRQHCQGQARVRPCSFEDNWNVNAEREILKLTSICSIYNACAITTVRNFSTHFPRLRKREVEWQWKKFGQYLGHKFEWLFLLLNHKQYKRGCIWVCMKANQSRFNIVNKM